MSKIVIERPHKKCRVTIHSARPGVVIGKKGADIELRKKVAELTDSDVVINIVEIRKPELDAPAGRRIDRAAARAPRRLPPRHEARGAVGDAARRRGHPHQLLRAASAAPRSRAWSGIARAACRCIRCAPTSTTAFATAFTTYGTCGVKVWIFKGEIMEHDPMAQDKSWSEGDVRPPPARRDRSEKRKAKNMLQPKRTKFRKAHKGRIHGVATSGATLAFGQYGLKALGAGARHRAPDRGRAARDDAPHEARRPGVDPHLPDVPVSKKPIEVRMGKGKGTPEFWVCRVKPGRCCSRSTA